MTAIHHAQARERMFERRAARLRRARWLARTLFALMGLGLMASFFTYPDLANDIVAWSHRSDVPEALRTVERPAEIEVRVMSRDVLPVRRGNAAFGN